MECWALVRASGFRGVRDLWVGFRGLGGLGASGVFSSRVWGYSECRGLWV